MTPLTAPAALDAYFLEARSKLLDLAAIFDRIDRGGTVNDARMQKLKTALSILNESNVGRAERVQELFSLAYDPAWKVPAPKSDQSIPAPRR